MRTLTIALLSGTLLVPGAALAQTTAPAAPAGPPQGTGQARTMRPMPRLDAAMPLRMAYHEIGMAEALGASGRYLDSARAHYRAGIAANGTDARKASGEARVAGDLARVALAQRPAPTPRDLPAPPSPAPRGSGAMAMSGGPGMGGPGTGGGPGMGGPGMGGFGMGGPGMGGHGMSGGHSGHGGFRGHDGIDPVELAELAKRDSSPEVKQLIADAIAAQNAAQSAATGGNVEEARRQMHIGGAIAHAARDLVFANVRPAQRTN